MRRRQSGREDTDLSWDGRAMRWSPYSPDVPGWDSNLWMCASDVGTNIWSHFYRIERAYGRRVIEPVRLENCSQELAEILIDSLPFCDYREGLSHVVRDFAKMVGQQFVLEGSLPFELRAGWAQSGDKPVLKAATLMYLFPDSILRVGRLRFQIVPLDEEHDREGTIMRLDPKRLVVFAPPLQYRRALIRMRNAFPVIGASQHWWMSAFGESRVREDFKSAMRDYDTARARISAPVGWNGRGLLSQYTADFHWVLRQLQWHRFCIEIRECILVGLREVFARIGALNGETPILVWDNLPTLQEVESAESKIMEGKTSFEDALRPFGMEVSQAPADEGGSGP